MDSSRPLSRLLAGVPSDVQDEIVARASRQHWSRGRMIVRMGEPADRLYVLEHGHALVQVSTRLGDVATLDVLGPADVFGEIGVSRQSGLRTAHVTALDDVETISLDRRLVDQLRQRLPSVDHFLHALAIHRLRRTTDRLIEALFDPVEHRVVSRLLGLTALWDSDARTILPVTQEQLASLAGTTRSTANRVLRPLVEEGIITLRRGEIEVLDVDAIERRIEAWAGS